MSRERRRSRVGPGLALAGLLMLAACTSTRRHEVLSFFFDGVPSPDGVEAEAPRMDATPSAFAELRAARARNPLPTPEPMRSVHEPYRNRECRGCHEGMFRIDAVEMDIELCDRCHQDQREAEGWDHGPINLGRCIPCHQPHRSTHEHLLSRGMPDLCLNCHLDVRPGEADYHNTPQFEQCTHCHAAHRMDQVKAPGALEADAATTPPTKGQS